MASSIYLFFIYLIPIIIGMITLSASAYGLGKHEKNKNSPEYNASLVFLIIGLLVSVVSIVLWQQGNYTSGQCKSVIDIKSEDVKKVVDIGKEAAEEAASLKKELVDVDLNKKLGALVTV